MLKKLYILLNGEKKDVFVTLITGYLLHEVRLTGHRKDNHIWRKLMENP